MAHRLPLWFDRFDMLTALRPSKGFAHHPESIEGRSGPPAHNWSTTLIALEPGLS